MSARRAAPGAVGLGSDPLTRFSHAQLAEHAERQAQLARKYNPGRVDRGTMSTVESRRDIAKWDAIALTLRMLARQEAGR